MHLKVMALLFVAGLVGGCYVLTQGKFVSAQISSEGAISGVAHVIDGDTIAIGGTHIRLEGIDAPETGQLCYFDGTPWRCGNAATASLAQHAYGKEVRCSPIGTDRYDRVLATCFVETLNLNEHQVRTGNAIAYRRFSTEYVPLEDAARSQRLGLWGSTFMLPSQWRAARRSSGN